MRVLRAILPAVLFCAWLTVSASPAAAGGLRVEDDDLYLKYSGTWMYRWDMASSGGSTRVASKAGSNMTASFDGTGCALVSRTGPDRGKARIYIDGNIVRDDLSLYTSRVAGPGSVWATDTLAPGPHTVKVLVLGTKEAASSGRWVVVDALEVLGTPTGARVPPGTTVDERSANLVVLGGWRRSTRSGPLYGTSVRTSTRGSTVTLRFRGSAVYVLGRKDATSGRSEIVLDGRLITTVGQLSSATKERRVVWSVSGLDWGEHTLTVRATGRPVWTGRGTISDVDAFAVNGSVLKAQRPTPFNYPWRTYIVIDKSSFRLYWVRNGILVKTYPIAHGKVGSPTPSRVWRIDAKYMTDPSSVYGPRKMRLFKRVSTRSGYAYVFTAYGIHGTNQPWVIGTQASHGCIRMYNRDVLELWPQVPLHTIVVTRY